MNCSRVEKIIIASPILVNLGLSFALMQLDLYLQSSTLNVLLALLAMTFYPIFAGLVLRSKAALGLFLISHIITALLAIFTIYNDSALIYLYVSLGLFAVTVGISRILRKKSPSVQ